MELCLYNFTKRSNRECCKRFHYIKGSKSKKIVYIYCQNSLSYDFDYLSGFQKLKITFKKKNFAPQVVNLKMYYNNFWVLLCLTKVEKLVSMVQTLDFNNKSISPFSLSKLSFNY